MQASCFHHVKLSCGQRCLFGALSAKTFYVGSGESRSPIFSPKHESGKSYASGARYLSHLPTFSGAGPSRTGESTR